MNPVKKQLQDMVAQLPPDKFGQFISWWFAKSKDYLLDLFHITLDKNPFLTDDDYKKGIEFIDKLSCKSPLKKT